jgi:hypothetical protein
MAKYISDRQRKLKIGITSYTESLTVLEVTGGAYISSSVGIGTTVPTQSLHVQGNARIAGAIYDSNNTPGTSGQVIQSTVTGIRWSDPGITTYADKSGIATYATYAGYATTAGIATYATYAGYATTAGIATNLAGGAKNSIPYQTGVNSTGFIAYGTTGYVLTTDGANGAPYWAPLSIDTLIGKLIVRDEGQIVGTAYSINQLDFRGPNIVATAEPFGNIATITVADYVSNSGYSTISGYASTAGIATYATYAGFSTTAGVSTSVIGGIASVTQLNVSGISTLGFITASDAYFTGIVTANQFYGSGSNLTGIIPNTVSTSSTTIPQYIGFLTTNSGTTTSILASSTLTYIPSSGNLGVGSTNPTSKLYVDGDGYFTGVVTASSFIGVVTSATSVIGGIASVTSLSVSGISTLGTVLVSSGIVSATSGIVTYYGDGSGLINIRSSSITGGIGYVDYAGVSTSVIGGIASVTSLSVSGISTLGTVLVSSGIVSATSGIVTYYGDGSKLTGIQTSGGVSVVNQDPTVSSAVYPTLVSNIGIASLGISTTKLSFIPSTNRLGVGTGTPRENLDVIGSIGIQSAGTSNRFYIQHNSSQSSLDFIFV